MKYVKMLGLLAIAAAALMAFMGTASAATLTSPTTGTVYSGKIVASAGVTTLDGTINVSCNLSHVEGSITNSGGGVPTQTVEGSISKLEFTECGKDTVTVTSAGTLSVHSIGNNTGTVTSSGATVDVRIHRTIFGFPVTTHCAYVTNNTHIGTLTGSNHTGGGHTTATLHISGSIPQKETDSGCGNDAFWTGTYTVTSPDHLYVD